jgi:hypothetical protein
MQRPKPGDYFKRKYGDLTIYGYAMTLKEIEDEERSLGADAEELDFTLRMMNHQIAEGYVWGMAYSVACVKGEYGLTPARQAVVISKEAFERARSVDWTD